MELTDLIRFAIREDAGDGDHTSLACIPEGTTSKAKLLVKESGVLAGINSAKHIFAEIDPSLKIEWLKKDGDIVQKDDIAFFVEGSVHSILLGERLVLNIMQRMSGIASITRKIVDSLQGTKCKVLDTRKTTPLLRALEKEAVRIGGGTNHRIGLYDMILIKDNHVDYAGGITKALDATRNYLGKTGKNLRIEIETRNLNELAQAIQHGGFHRVMFDNYSLKDLRKGVEMVAGKFETEASGGITPENAYDYAATGVDFISMGCLTHSVKSMDLSLKAC
ncbi:MAG TPA: carboxylating nicotinate-nucleotide diphosphorylase [Flavobacteriales bacterium]|nr:carboxylating nicotinate-nucleotide diphosphorylase [Flavobacteriales bacterium]HRJ36994.1 carboxylating nicotinate-nucleotide diphosphorylase [Flavobacteriales bacterium]HRJ39607.1 carboxylating nicotinate-nucleotide diphosphorylase [Flavobacteriales bacterium]